MRPNRADTIARVYLRIGKYEQAAALFGSRQVMNLNAAIARVKTGRIAEARKSYKEVHILTYYPDLKSYMPGSSNARAIEATVFLGRGIVDFHHRRYNSAIWALEQALPLIPENPLALWYYAEVLAAVGRTRESRRFFLAAIRNDQGIVARRARASMAKLGLAG